MAPHVEKLPIPPLKHGEGPHWDSNQRALFIIDASLSMLYKYVPATKKVTKALFETPDEIVSTMLIPVTSAPDLFIVNFGHKIQVIRWDGENDSKVELVKVVAELEKEHHYNMVNDSKVDSRGRLYTGTIGLEAPLLSSNGMFQPTGGIYSVNSDGTSRRHDTGVRCSNGIAIDEAHKSFYHVDTFEKVIRRFDYDVETGNLSNKAVVFDYERANEPGLPDGMTVDTDGNLWVASLGGHRLLRVDPQTGGVTQTFTFDELDVTSVAFGGDNLDVLYVTTGDKQNLLKAGGGATYAITGLGVRGYKNNSFPIKN